MRPPKRLLDVLVEMAADGPFTSILATTFTFDPEFFVHSGVLPALAGELDRTRATGDERRRRVDAEVVRDRLGNPYVAVLQGFPTRSGATPGWIDRLAWNTRRHGVLHAKCLVAVGPELVNVIVTSANLTEGSWCQNLEVAVSWSAPRNPTTAGERRRAEAAAQVVAGIVSLARLVKATSLIDEASKLHDELTNSADPAPVVVWSGKTLPGHPLEDLARGDEAVVISPFWNDDDNSASTVTAALKGLAPTVTLAGRKSSNGSGVELPGALGLAAQGAGFKLSTSSEPDAANVEDSSLSIRRLHAKQIAVRSGSAWRSYVGSANATLQGLALGSGPNVELGVIVDIPPLVRRDPTVTSVDPHGLSDPEDPAALRDDEAGWPSFYGRAFLAEDGNLALHIDPAPDAGAKVEIPTGAESRPLIRKADHVLHLEGAHVARLVNRAEITIVTAEDVRLAVPVVLDDALKRQVGGSGAGIAQDLDELLACLARNPIRSPSDDDWESSDQAPSDTPSGPMPSPPLPRKPVHRAREAIEVVMAVEGPLQEFLERNPSPTDRLVELRLGGTGSIVDLARRIAMTSGSEHGLTKVASAFVATEIGLLLNRLSTPISTVSPALQGLRDEVRTLASDLVRAVEAEDKRAAALLVKLGETK